MEGQTHFYFYNISMMKIYDLSYIKNLENSALYIVLCELRR